MSKIDSVGTFLGECLEAAVSASSGGFPQLVVRAKVTQKYVETPDELAHFKLTEPQYVDYSSYDYDDVGYFVLFNNDGALLNYEQVQKAFGWDGTAFETLPDAAKGKTFLFRMEENTYKEKTSLKMTWIDAADASPTRTLKALDAASLKDLSSKFITKKPAAKPARPTAKPAAAPSAPTGTTPSAPSSPASTPPAVTPAAANAAPTTAKRGKPKKTEAKNPAPAPAPAAKAAATPTEARDAAWEYVNSIKGDNEDQLVEDTWISACGEVGGDKEAKDFTADMWESVKATVIKDLDLKTA